MIRKYRRNRVSESRSPRRRMMKESYGVYDLIDYFDVWGNEEDGWDVNNLAKVEEGIYIDDSLSDEEIVDYLIDEVGFFSPSARGKIEVDSSSGDFIEFFNADTYEPLGRLERTRTVDESYRGSRKNKRGLVMEDIEDGIKDEFLYAFLLDRMTVFEVDFYTLGNNSHPYFSTSAARFSRNKRNYTSAGQAQERLLYGKAKKFYEKWDHLHLKDLTDEEYDEIVRDIDELKRAYPYHIAYEFNGKATRTTIPFYEIYEKSMEVPRKR